MQVQKSCLSTIWLRMAENINSDFLEFFLITSQAAGLEESVGRPFGMGKSTLAIWMAYRAWAYHKNLLKFEKDPATGDLALVELATEQQRLDLMRHIVTNYTVWHIDTLIEKIQKTTDFIPAIVWDDVQDSAPALQHVPEHIVVKIGYLTRVRQRVANLILTAPSISEIAKPLRRCITWEIIVPQRGVYEVQFLLKRRDFYKPTEDKLRMWYETTGYFDPLPEQIDKLYKQLRNEQLNTAPEPKRKRR